MTMNNVKAALIAFCGVVVGAALLWLFGDELDAPSRIEVGDEDRED